MDKMKTKRTKKIQKGGTILGTGRDGCVIDPPLMCSSKVSSVNKVSKLIDTSSISDEEYDQFVGEYKVGQVFKKVDPYSQHFLPGIEMCDVVEDEISHIKPLMKDVKDCGYKKRNKKTYMLNIVMKKGKDFEKITRKLNKMDVLKSMAYLLNGALHSIYDLNTCLLDVK